LQRILLGEEPGKIPYAFAPGEELVINMTTARQIEVHPPRGVYTEAAIASQERFLKNTNRNFFLPDLVAQAEYSYIFKEGGAGSDVTQNIDPNDSSGAFISSIRNNDN
jgi:hypothetical protein